MHMQCLLEPNCKCWLSTVRDFLFSAGLEYVWYEDYVNEKLVLLQMRQRLKDIFIQKRQQRREVKALHVRGKGHFHVNHGGSSSNWWSRME